MFKLAAAAIIVAAVAYGGFRLLDDEGRSPARVLAAPAREVAAELDRARERAEEPREPQWVQEANALCRAQKLELEALGRPQSVEELVPFLRDAVRIAERYERQSRTLRAPLAEQPRIRQLNRLSTAGMKLLRGMLRAAERGDGQALLDNAEDAVALAREWNPLVRELGLHDCATPPTGLPA